MVIGTGHSQSVLLVGLFCFWGSYGFLGTWASSSECRLRGSPDGETKAFEDPGGLCTCAMFNGTPTNRSVDQVWVTCVNLTSLDYLSRLMTSLKGTEIHKFLLGVSRVGYLPSNLFLDVVVHELQIWDTPISDFVRGDEAAFLGLEKSLRGLAMRRCLLNSMMPFERMGNLLSLESMDLSFNNLTTVREIWFQKFLNSLTSLLLRGNAIDKIESRAFASLYRLTQLDLSQNNIKTLQRSMFPDGLFFLVLSDNRLSHLPDDLFSKMLNLRRIYLNGNRITTLAYPLWSSVWSNSRLGVELLGNPLVCDCALHWLVELGPRRCLSKDCQRAPADYKQLDGHCNSPPSVAGQHLNDMTCDTLPCDTPCPKRDSGESNDVFQIPPE